MNDQITSIEKIKIGAHLAVQLNQTLAANPYVENTASHIIWARYHSAFSLAASFPGLSIV